MGKRSFCNYCTRRLFLINLLECDCGVFPLLACDVGWSMYSFSFSLSLSLSFYFFIFFYIRNEILCFMNLGD